MVLYPISIAALPHSSTCKQFVREKKKKGGLVFFSSWNICSQNSIYYFVHTLYGLMNRFYDCCLVLYCLPTDDRRCSGNYTKIHYLILMAGQMLVSVLSFPLLSSLKNKINPHLIYTHLQRLLRMIGNIYSCWPLDMEPGDFHAAPAVGWERTRDKNGTKLKIAILAAIKEELNLSVWGSRAASYICSSCASDLGSLSWSAVRDGADEEAKTWNWQNQSKPQ